VKNHRTSFRPSSTTYVNRAIWASELDSKPFLTTSFFPPLLVFGSPASGRRRPGFGLDFPRQNADPGYHLGAVASLLLPGNLFHLTARLQLATDILGTGGGGDAIPRSNQKVLGQTSEEPTKSDTALLTKPSHEALPACQNTLLRIGERKITGRKEARKWIFPLPASQARV